MRILFWSTTFWPHIGGVETLAAKFLPAMRQRGYDYLVITPKQEPHHPDVEHYTDIPIYRFPFAHPALYTNLNQVAELQQQVAVLKRHFAPDLIHLNGVGISDFFHHLTASSHRAPVLATLHGEWRHLDNGYDLIQRTLRAADWVCGSSEAILKLGRQLAPDLKSHSSVIHNGIDIPELSPVPLPTDTPRFLCLGRLAPEKGFDVALTAFATICERFPQASLVVAGDGPTHLDLKQQAATLGLSHAVRFVGSVDPLAVPALINEATIVLMPSRQESLPMVALEAAIMARPVVASRVGGLPEVIAHHETGLLVETEDSKAMAEAALFLLERSDLMTHIGQVARRRAQERFSWEQHLAAYDALYQQLRQ